MMNAPRNISILILFFTVHVSIAAIEKPNFIIILADDLGYGDLGYTGSTQIKTPNIDKLAENGVFFTNGYVTSAVCSPSRAGLLTGRHNCEFGYYTNPGIQPSLQPQINREYIGLPVNEITLADRLGDLGYINGLMGKWHLGRLPQFHPLKRGFHEFWGYLNGGHDYYITVPRSETKIRYRWPIECNYKKQGALTYITDDKGNECVDFIKRHKDEPFFLFASFNAPFRGQKGTLLEGGIHVPFIISYPGKYKAGMVYDKPVISLDLLPTFVALAGGEISDEDNIHGVNLSPFITGKSDHSPHDYLMWNIFGVSAIRHGDMKMVNLPDKLPMLYNLSEDISEQNDIMDSNKEIAIKLIEELGMWNMSCPEPLFFQGNEQKLGYRKLYDVVSPPQPGTIKKNITL